MPTPTVQIHAARSGAHAPNNNSIIATLRAIAPQRLANFEHSLRLAERQAAIATNDQQAVDQIPIDLIIERSRIRIEYSLDQHLPRASFWDVTARQWVIQLRWADTWKQHRFHIAHEFKRILDHGKERQLYPSGSSICLACQAESAADHFARHFLVPAHLLRRAQQAGLTDTTTLADIFGITEDVIRDRLGYTDDHSRDDCASPVTHHQPRRAPI
ncbi:ImmA/IrrE family metallo-endopeptidase [Nocardia wallacei]|uniref:ImmA/IrrE family metallo-endopeptidase n=1 Tax=Nocardia wallacei TaxID=480035 RepID=UPI002458975F|nr:ImmA/IrrE family metallo-endopeptidase [Nocardia wallacei]